jgi:hypothetical protein
MFFSDDSFLLFIYMNNHWEGFCGICEGEKTKESLSPLSVHLSASIRERACDILGVEMVQKIEKGNRRAIRKLKPLSALTEDGNERKVLLDILQCVDRDLN